jgi:RNA polymerase sigma factor (sigma-70 family)
MIDFASWYSIEYPRVVNALTLLTGDQQVSTEAASEAFVRALAKWDRVSKMDSPGGWLYKVALNDARRRLRRSSRERDTAVDLGWTPSSYIPAERDHDLWNAVARLPHRTRSAVVLRYVADLTEPAIAQALGVQRGTVATMLRRAHSSLAEELGPNYSSERRLFHAF